MTETKETIEAVEETTETVETTEPTNQTAENTVEVLEDLSLEELTQKRMGTFKVGLSYKDAVYYRNLLDKSEFTGPQQAYLLIIAKAELSQVCEALKSTDQMARHEVQLTSATIESLGYFMNKMTGKGADSATKLFSASMLLRPVMGEINKIDEILSAKKSEEDTKE